jgi:mycothiol synthase
VLAVDGLVEWSTLERWRHFLAISYVDHGRDFHVIESGDDIVGILSSFEMDDPRVQGGVRRVRVIVDPAHRRRGLGTRLLRIGESMGRDGGQGAVQTFVPAAWSAGLAFAKAHGFEVLVHDLFLRRGIAAFVAPPPAGTSIRAYVPGADDEAWMDLANRTLSRDVGFHPETVASLTSYTKARGFALWIAESDGVTIGFCHVEARDDDAYIHALGVLPEHEGFGVGAALLARGIETLRVARTQHIELCTEKPNVRAQRLYARAGFILDREAFTLRKPLAPS